MPFGLSGYFSLYFRQEAKILLLTYLRCNVVGRSAERLRGRVAEDSFFAHAKVSDLDVAVLIEEDIVQFEVSVDDAARVQEEQADRNLGRVKPAPFREEHFPP